MQFEDDWKDKLGLLAFSINTRKQAYVLWYDCFLKYVVDYLFLFNFDMNSEPTSTDDLITKHDILLNTFFFIYCVLGFVLNKIFIFFQNTILSLKISRNNFKHKIGIMILLNLAFKKSRPVQSYQTFTMYFVTIFLFKVGIKNKILDRV